jgi:hypothetical protein
MDSATTPDPIRSKWASRFLDRYPKYQLRIQEALDINHLYAQRHDTVNLRHNEVIVNHKTLKDYQGKYKQISGSLLPITYLGLRISSRNKPQKCGVWYEIRYGEVRYGEGSLYSEVSL